MISRSQERDRNISTTCVFIFHNSIQHDEAFGYTFYNEIDSNSIQQIGTFQNFEKKTVFLEKCSVALKN